MVIQGYQNCTWKVNNMAYVNIDQIILRKTEIWDKMFNFEDIIGLLVLKMIDPHDLRWDIDGIGARDGVDPKLRSKSYSPNMDLELNLDTE